MAKYEIYQIKMDEYDKYRGLIFAGFEDAEKWFGKGAVKKENYQMVYQFDGFEIGQEVTLDYIYYIFNMRRPSDFLGHSLSVSDVVKTPDGYFYCDSFGWKKLDWEV